MKFIQLLKENYESKPYAERLKAFIGETITNKNGASYQITSITDSNNDRLIFMSYGNDGSGIMPKSIVQGTWTTENQQLYDLCKEYVEFDDAKTNAAKEAETQKLFTARQEREEREKAYFAKLQQEQEMWAEHDEQFKEAYADIPKAIFKTLIPELNQKFSLFLNSSDDLKTILQKFHHKTMADLDAATRLLKGATAVHNSEKAERQAARSRASVLADHNDTANFKTMDASQKALTLAWLAKYTSHITLTTNDRFSNDILDKFRGSPYIDNHAFAEVSNSDKTSSGNKKKYWWSIIFDFSRDANFNTCPIEELALHPMYSYGNNGLFETLYKDHGFDFSYNDYPAANGRQDAKKIASTLSPEEQVQFWDAYNNPDF